MEGIEEGITKTCGKNFADLFERKGPRLATGRKVQEEVFRLEGDWRSLCKTCSELGHEKVNLTFDHFEEVHRRSQGKLTFC